MSFVLDDCFRSDDGKILITDDGRKFKWKTAFYVCLECSITVVAKVKTPNIVIDKQHICEARNKDEVIENYLIEEEAARAEKEKSRNSQQNANEDAEDPNNSNQPILPRPQKRKRRAKSFAPKKKPKKNPSRTRQSRYAQALVISTTSVTAAATPILPNESNDNNAQTRRSQSAISEYTIFSNSREPVTAAPAPTPNAPQNRRYPFHFSDYVPEIPNSATPIPPPIPVTSPPHYSSVICRNEQTNTNSTTTTTQPSSREQSSSTTTLRQPSADDAASANTFSSIQQNVTRSRTSVNPSVNQNNIPRFENRRVLCNRLLNPSENVNEEESDDDDIILLEDDIQIIEENEPHANNNVMFENPFSPQQTFPQNSEEILPTQYRQSTSAVQKSDLRNIADDDENNFEENETNYFVGHAEPEIEMEEKVFGEDKYDPALLTYNRPSERSLKVAAKQLRLSYSPECYNFWSKIKVEVIKSRSDSIKTGPKLLTGFQCLSLFLTGSSKQGDTLWKNVNLKLNSDMLMREEYNLQKRYDMTLNFCADHLKLICYWLSCRIGVYQNGELTKYGDWRRSSESNDLIILIEKIGDKYSPIFNL